MKAKAGNPFASVSDVEWARVGQPSTATFMGGLPVHKPPYAHLTAIDLTRGEIKWRVPFGKGSNFIRNHKALAGVNVPARLGTPGPQGAIVTGGGLVFIGGGDDALYAFDKDTGKEIWSGALPRRTSGTPMTYRARSGRQFVVVATGGGTDAALVAFALPQKPWPLPCPAAVRNGVVLGRAVEVDAVRLELPACAGFHEDVVEISLCATTGCLPVASIINQ